MAEEEGFDEERSDEERNTRVASTLGKISGGRSESSRSPSATRTGGSGRFSTENRRKKHRFLPIPRLERELKKLPIGERIFSMAEEEGFEPSVRIAPRRFSRPLP